MQGLIVVIPALNESATIGAVIQKCLEITEHVIVVDDGSSDSTGQVASLSGAIVIRHDAPQGYDPSVADGLNRAFELGAAVAITCDADGQHRVEDVKQVAEPVIRGEADFSAGIRDHYNRPIEAVVGIFSKQLFGTWDPFCGLKCYGRKIYQDFGRFPRDMNIGTLPLVWVRKAKLRSSFVPIQTSKRADRPRFGVFISANMKLARAFYRSAARALSSS